MSEVPLQWVTCKAFGSALVGTGGRAWGRLGRYTLGDSRDRERERERERESVATAPRSFESLTIRIDGQMLL